MRRKETYHFNILTSDTNEYIVAGVPNMHTPNLKIQTQVAKHRRAANKPPKEVITLNHKMTQSLKTEKEGRKRTDGTKRNQIAGQRFNRPHHHSLLI